MAELDLNSDILALELNFFKSTIGLTVNCYKMLQIGKCQDYQIGND